MFGEHTTRTPTAKDARIAKRAETVRNRLTLNPEEEKALLLQNENAKKAFYQSLKRDDEQRIKDILYTFALYREEMETNIAVIASPGVSIDSEQLVGCLFLDVVHTRDNTQNTSMKENTIGVLTRHAQKSGHIKEASLFSPDALVLGNTDQTPLFMTFTTLEKPLIPYTQSIMRLSSDLVVLGTFLQFGSYETSPLPLEKI